MCLVLCWPLEVEWLTRQTLYQLVKTFIKHLLCIRHRSKKWEYSNEQNKVSVLKEFIFQCNDIDNKHIRICDHFWYQNVLWKKESREIWGRVMEAGEQLYLESGKISLKGDIWVKTWVTRRKQSWKNLVAENRSRAGKGTAFNWQYT